MAPRTREWFAAGAIDARAVDALCDCVFAAGGTSPAEFRESLGRLDLTCLRELVSVVALAARAAGQESIGLSPVRVQLKLAASEICQELGAGSGQPDIAAVEAFLISIYGFRGSAPELAGTLALSTGLSVLSALLPADRATIRSVFGDARLAAVGAVRQPADGDAPNWRISLTVAEQGTFAAAALDTDAVSALTDLCVSARGGIEADPEFGTRLDRRRCREYLALMLTAIDVAQLESGKPAVAGGYLTARPDAAGLLACASDLGQLVATQSAFHACITQAASLLIAAAPPNATTGSELAIRAGQRVRMLGGLNREAIDDAAAHQLTAIICAGQGELRSDFQQEFRALDLLHSRELLTAALIMVRDSVFPRTPDVRQPTPDHVAAAAAQLSVSVRTRLPEITPPMIKAVVTTAAGYPPAVTDANNPAGLITALAILTASLPAHDPAQVLAWVTYARDVLHS